MLRIVTDSSANLPERLVQQYNIAVVPLNVHIGEKSYQEGINLSREEFYRRLPKTHPLPTTSQPSAGQFQEVYERIFSDGDEVLSMHLSSRLSGTYASAAGAKSMMRDAPLTLFDSGTVSVGLGILVLAAARAAQDGFAREEIVALLEKMAARTIIYFTVDTLEYLQRGGRIGTAAAWVGTILQLKPVLAIEQGEVLATDRVRTRKRALSRLLALLAEHCSAADAWWAGVAHIQADEESTRLTDTICRDLPITGALKAEIGPVIGTHGGPGTIGVALSPAPSTFDIDFPSFSVILGYDSAPPE